MEIGLINKINRDNHLIINGDKYIIKRQKTREADVKKDSGEEKDGNDRELERVIDEINRNLKIMYNIDIKFKIHKPTGKTMITVINADTGKVIREIPPLEILNLAAKIDQMLGIIFDKKG